jgi:hypothetical protein
MSLEKKTAKTQFEKRQHILLMTENYSSNILEQFSYKKKLSKRNWKYHLRLCCADPSSMIEITSLIDILRPPQVTNNTAVTIKI